LEIDWEIEYGIATKSRRDYPIVTMGAAHGSLRTGGVGWAERCSPWEPAKRRSRLRKLCSLRSSDAAYGYSIIKVEKRYTDEGLPT